MKKQPLLPFQIGCTLGAAAAVMLALTVEGAGDGLLTGTVTSVAGAPIEGVVVSAQVDGEPITT